jgi:hypothetical protein
LVLVCEAAFEGLGEILEIFEEDFDAIVSVCGCLVELLWKMMDLCSA